MTGDTLQTEFAFTLPNGFVSEDGTLHREGQMRLATAADEILPLKDPRVRSNESYLTIILLSRVVTRLGGLPDVTPQTVENLFVADLAHLQDMYERVNDRGMDAVDATCPDCGESFAVEVGGTSATVADSAEPPTRPTETGDPPTETPETGDPPTGTPETGDPPTGTPETDGGTDSGTHPDSQSLTRAASPAGDTTADRPPQDATSDQPPQDATADRPPQDVTSDQPPQDATSDQPPQDVTGHPPGDDGASASADAMESPDAGGGSGNRHSPTAGSRSGVAAGDDDRQAGGRSSISSTTRRDDPRA
jgi:hypothetical protein